MIIEKGSTRIQGSDDKGYCAYSWGVQFGSLASRGIARCGCKPCYPCARRQAREGPKADWPPYANWFA